MAKVHYADLWGLREGKYEYLRENDLISTGWQGLAAVPPYFFLVPKEFDLYGEYSRGWSIADALPLSSTGIKTHRDHFVVGFDRADLEERIGAFADAHLSDGEVRESLSLRDTRDWSLSRSRQILRDRDNWRQCIKPYLYRPFDHRVICYAGELIEFPRPAVMRNMVVSNIALVSVRQLVADTFRHVYVTRALGDGNAISPSSREYNHYFPLYLYSETKKQEPVKRGGIAVTLALFESQPGYGTRKPNLATEFVSAVANKLVLTFVPDAKGDLEGTFGPEDIFHYMYAVFHSPTYRERYAEFLKIDFPRLPLTSDLGLFRALAEKGEELVALHLMESPALDHPIVKFPVKGSSEVEKVRYAEPAEGRPGLVYINKAQYFEGVEREVWEFHIGGYQVLEKWLKDRKGRTLSYDDVSHYGRIVVALKETIRLMGEIDGLIPSWPIE